jgi:exodeoxyribonuclease V alpha subunit
MPTDPGPTTTTWPNGAASPGGSPRGPARPVTELAPLSGDGYEAWVAGLDPETGQPRGRLRADASAVRFVEIVVNGPKSWSLAAELYPDLAAAYEAAQDSAAAWLV